MNGAKHKLCAILREDETDTGETQDEDSTNTDHGETGDEVWQFDPGICG